MCRHHGRHGRGGHTESIALADIENIFRGQQEAVLYFRDGSTLPIRFEDAERILKLVPGLEGVGANVRPATMPLRI